MKIKEEKRVIQGGEEGRKYMRILLYCFSYELKNLSRSLRVYCVIHVIHYSMGKENSPWSVNETEKEEGVKKCG